MEDAQIIELYFKRDERAITKTDQKYGKALKSLSMRILADDSDGDECVNDTYLRAWNTIPPTNPLSLSAYLHRIVRSVSIDRLRAKKSEKRRMGEYAASLDELAQCIAGEETPELAMQAQELEKLIEVFLQNLRKDKRQIFLCRYYFLDPIKTIASNFKMSESKVKSILYRLRCELKERLEQEGFFI